MPDGTLGAPGSFAEPTRESQTNTDQCLSCYGYSFGGMLALSETLWMYMSNRLPSTANMMHGSLFIITSES